MQIKSAFVCSFHDERGRYLGDVSAKSITSYVDFVSQFKDVYSQIRQLQDGFSTDTATWSSWDEEVRQMTIALGDIAFKLPDLDASVPTPAAPAPESAEPVGWQQRYIGSVEEGPSAWQHCSDSDAEQLALRTDYELRRVYAAPQPTHADGVREPPERELLREVAKRGATTDVLRRIDALLATPQPAAEAQEPMAWMTPGGDVSRSKKWCEERCFPGGEQPFPLYTRPAAQEGWKLVPVEPTAEMWDEAWKSIGLPYRAKLSIHEIRTLFDKFHAAMLSSAPQPKGGERE